MVRSSVRVQITTHPTNLDFSAVVSLNGITWDVIFTNEFVKATSREEFEIQEKGGFEFDRKMNKLMNQIVGHIRNLAYFTLDLDLKWGYKGVYGNHGFHQDGAIFPSIHQQQTCQFTDENIDHAKRMLSHIGKSRRKGLKTMLNYWRRAAELDNLGYNSESFLNYYKVFECLSELNTNERAKKAILKRFCLDGKPQATLRKRYHAKEPRDERNLERQISFVAKVLSASGFSANVNRNLFVSILDCVYMRHWWNVAHKLIRSNPYDEYDSIGQHSDEFNLVEIENYFIETLTKLAILLYVKPGLYRIDSSRGIPITVPSVPPKH